MKEQAEFDFLSEHDELPGVTAIDQVDVMTKRGPERIVIIHVGRFQVIRVARWDLAAADRLMDFIEAHQAPRPAA